MLEKNAGERASPKLGITFTINLPACSAISPTWIAAQTAAPAEIQHNNTYSVASLRAMLIASSLLTVTISSTYSVFRILGMNIGNLHESRSFFPSSTSEYRIVITLGEVGTWICLRT
jgi:hypothetical protein